MSFWSSELFPTRTVFGSTLVRLVLPCLFARGLEFVVIPNCECAVPATRFFVGSGGFAPCSAALIHCSAYSL